jgi:hypothetical protein
MGGSRSLSSNQCSTQEDAQVLLALTASESLTALTPCNSPCCGAATCAPQVLGVAEKRRAALKRKLSALQTSANEKLADAERKVAKINQQASKLPSLGEWPACI